MNLEWALEVEITHIDRLVNIIISCGLVGNNENHIRVQPNYSGTTSGISGFIYVCDNVLIHPAFPYECLKYISRVFYVPFSCRHPDWLVHHKYLSRLSSENDVVLKLSCSPKELEPLLGECIYDIYANKSSGVKFDLHPSRNTHMLMCLYDPVQSIFKWGVMAKSAIEENLMTSESIAKFISEKRCAVYKHLSVEPVCRAYFKLDEILNLWLPLWGWKLPTGRPRETGYIAVDIGASPGGWTQRLAGQCSVVIAVDPGLLRPEILELDNVCHLPWLAQSSEVTGVLDNIRSEAANCDKMTGKLADLITRTKAKLRFLVCDINCEARMTADCLTSSVLPYMEGFGCCCGEADSSKTSGALSTSTILVITLKLFKNPKENSIARAIKDVVETIDRQFSTVRCKNGCRWEWDWKTGNDCYCVHLCANSTNERTVVLRRRCSVIY